MPVSSTWTNPSPGGSMDLSAGALVSEANMDTIVSNILWLGGVAGVITQRAYASSASAETTTSNTGVVLAAPQVSLTVGGGDVIIIGGISVANSTLAALNSGYIGVDGTLTSLALWSQPVATHVVANTMLYMPSPLSSALHLFTLGWACSTGTLTTSTQTSRWILALEIRR